MTQGWSGEWPPSRYAPLLLPVLTPDGRDPSTKLTSVVCNKTGSRCVSGTRARSLVRILSLDQAGRPTFEADGAHRDKSGQKEGEASRIINHCLRFCTTTVAAVKFIRTPKAAFITRAETRLHDTSGCTHSIVSASRAS